MLFQIILIDNDVEFNGHFLDIDPDINYVHSSISESQNFSQFRSVDEFLIEYKSLSTDSNSLSIFCQNIRSLEKNLDSFLCLFPHDKMPDIFIFSETWHNEEKQIHIPGFLGYHTVRHGRAGGVSIFIKSQFSSSFIEKFSYANDCIEICTVKFYTSTEYLFISGIYRPHSGSIDNFSAALENIFAHNEFPISSNIIAGDFNVNLMSTGGDVERMLDVMRSHHFFQTILSITRPGNIPSSSTLIDHIWINQLCGYNCGVVETGITDHHAVFIVVPFKVSKKNSDLD